MPALKLTPEEIGTRGEAIYRLQLRAMLEADHRGEFVAIDVETGDFSIGTEAHEASDQLRLRHPDASILVERIGYPAVFHVRSAGQSQ